MMEITNDDCKVILQKLPSLGEVIFKNFEISPFGNQLQGLIGEHFILRIAYEDRGRSTTSQFFLKTLSTNPLMLKISKELRVFEKEKFFYDHLLVEFSAIGIDVGFAPQSYLCTPSSTILEDLTTSGFKGTPKTSPLDLDQCKKCLRAIARFHGAGIIYEQRRGVSLLEKFPRELEDTFSRGNSSGVIPKILKASFEGLFVLIDHIPAGGVSCSDFKRALLQVLEHEAPLPGVVTSILHKDLWTTNFLHSVQSTKIIDFQTLSYGAVENDVVEFLMNTTRRDFRARHFDGLIGFYYKSLEGVLQGASLAGVLPSGAQFLESCGSFKISAKLHAVVDHSLTLLSDQVFGEVLRSEESFRKFLFADRGRYNCEAFESNAVFRDVLAEDLEELRDLLFASNSEQIE